MAQHELDGANFGDEIVNQQIRQNMTNAPCGCDGCDCGHTIEKLQTFKDWVHTYLDSKDVPYHPPGTHGAEGCRIGDRMDWLMAQMEALRRQNAELREAMEDAVKTIDYNSSLGYTWASDIQENFHFYKAARAVLANTQETP